MPNAFGPGSIWENWLAPQRQPSGGKRNLTRDEAVGIIQNRGGGSSDPMAMPSQSVGTNLGGAFLDPEGQYLPAFQEEQTDFNKFMGWQEGISEDQQRIAQDAISTILGVGNDDFSPTGAFANTFRMNVDNLAEQSIRSGMSKAGAAMGARGLSGSPRAALEARLTSDAIVGKGSAEAQLMDALSGRRAEMGRAQIGALGQISGQQIGALGGQTYPMADRLGWLESEQDYEILLEGIEEMKRAIAAGEEFDFSDIMEMLTGVLSTGLIT